MVFGRSETSADKSPLVLWDNVFQQGTLSASTEATNSEKENAVDGNTYDYWAPTTLPATLSVALDSSFAVSYAAIAAHTLGSSSSTIFVEYDSGGGTWVSLATLSPTDDSAIVIAFTETSATDFRFRVTGSTVPNLGVVYLGGGLLFDSGIIPGYTPLYMAESVQLLRSQTLSGQFITNRVNRKGASSSFQFNILDRSFVDSTAFQDFRRHYNDGKPFFFAGNPSELTKDVSYCWRKDGGEMKPTFSEDGIFYRTGMSLEAYIGNQ